MAWVYRQQMIEGETAFGIIHNSSYFFAELAVYEDGVINCWNKNDLNQFQNSLERGWVVPQIPIGESISVFQLGDFPVLDARWLHDKKSFYEYIVGIVLDAANGERARRWFRHTGRTVHLCGFQ